MANTKAFEVRIRAVFEEHGRASKEGGGKRLGAVELAAALDALGVHVNGQVRCLPALRVRACRWS